MFVEAFDEVDRPEQITIVEIAKALGDFINFEWRSFDSPYDAYLRTGAPLSINAEKGRKLFFGNAGCAMCHNGPLLSDQKFYALGLPAFGPGRTRRWDPIPRDVGRMGETDNLDDAYRFKTPSLRNVALTGPYGHNGAYPTLEGIVRHHLDPVKMRTTWKRDMAALPSVPWLEEIDFVIQSDLYEMARQGSKLDILPRNLSEHQIKDIVAFLESLTGKNALKGRLGEPDAVPSGLSID